MFLQTHINILSGELPCSDFCPHLGYWVHWAKGTAHLEEPVLEGETHILMQLQFCSSKLTRIPLSTNLHHFRIWKELVCANWFHFCLSQQKKISEQREQSLWKDLISVFQNTHPKQFKVNRHFIIKPTSTLSPKLIFSMHQLSVFHTQALIGQSSQVDKIHSVSILYHFKVELLVPLFSNQLIFGYTLIWVAYAAVMKWRPEASMWATT